MLSYFEAITLAPARCAQILTTSREGRSRVGRAVDARLRRARARLRARARRRALAHPWKVLARRGRCCSPARWPSVPLIPTEFIPSQDQSRLNVRIQTEAGTSVAAAEPLIDRGRADARQAPRGRAHAVDAAGSSGSMTLTLVPPEQRKLSAQAALARAAQGAVGDRRHPRVGPGSVAAGLRRVQGLPRRLHRARLGLGHARRPPR